MSILEWAAQAKRGDQYTYARGNLAGSRFDHAQALKNDIAPSADDDANVASGSDAWRLHERRQVALVQRRMGVDDFAYIAQRL